MKALCFKIALVPLVALLFSSCGGTSYEYKNTNDTPGPGLFSGEDGTFTVYEHHKETKVDEKEESEKKE